MILMLNYITVRKMIMISIDDDDLFLNSVKSYFFKYIYVIVKLSCFWMIEDYFSSNNII